MFKKISITILSIFLIQFFLEEAIAVEPDEVLQNPIQELRARNISKNIRCLICQGQSIDDSNSDFAINIKYVILKKLNQGLSEDEIVKLLEKDIS